MALQVSQGLKSLDRIFDSFNRILYSTRMKSTDTYQTSKCKRCHREFEQISIGAPKDYCDTDCRRKAGQSRFWIGKIAKDLKAGRNPLGDGKPDPLERILNLLNPFGS